MSRLTKRKTIAWKRNTLHNGPGASTDTAETRSIHESSVSSDGQHSWYNMIIWPIMTEILARHHIILSDYLEISHPNVLNMMIEPTVPHKSCVLISQYFLRLYELWHFPCSLIQRAFHMALSCVLQSWKHADASDLLTSTSNQEHLLRRRSKCKRIKMRIHKKER